MGNILDIIQFALLAWLGLVMLRIHEQQRWQDKEITTSLGRWRTKITVKIAVRAPKRQEAE